MNSTDSAPRKDTAQNEPAKRFKPLGQLKDLKPRGDVKAGWSSQQSSNGGFQSNKVIGGGG